MKCIVSEVTRYIDGDSFEARILWGEGVSDPVGVRVHGIDCPEMRGKCEYERTLAQQAARFTEQFLRDAERIELIVVKVDSYNRALCRVFGDGVSLRRVLIHEGLAKAYEGYKRQWC